MEFVKSNAPKIAIMTAAALAAAALLGSKGMFLKIAGTAAIMGAGIYAATKVV